MLEEILPLLGSQVFFILLGISFDEVVFSILYLSPN